jgi:hypothetical protein
MSFACVLLLGTSAAYGQHPTAIPSTVNPGDRNAQSEERAMVKAIEAAFNDPKDVNKGIRDAVRKAAQRPSADQESTVLLEVRRRYLSTPQHDEVVLQELRKMYTNPTPAQEDAVLAEASRLGRVPTGTVSDSTLADLAVRMFRKFDRDRDGALEAAEMPTPLTRNLTNWDRDWDGKIETKEYWEYFQKGYKDVYSKVMAGQIPIRVRSQRSARSAPVPATRNPNPTPPPIKPVTEPEVKPRPVYRAGHLPEGLPKWFANLDADKDGQIGLYEWREDGRAIKDFLEMDQNADGLLTPEEELAWDKEHSEEVAKATKQSAYPPRIGAEKSVKAAKSTSKK